MRAYSVIDVFTDEPYLGNPVAVVHDGAGLSTEQMQRFAAWTNLSETTFLLAATQPEADYRLRIFTPVLELPFAGHPTLGSCHAWMRAGGTPRGSSIVQECTAGLVRLRVQDRDIAFAAPPLLREGPAEEETIAHAAAVLGIRREQVLDAQWADNGPGWVAVLLEHAEAVLAMRPGFVDIDLGVVGPYPPGAPEQFEVRAFFPKDGVTVEDPVTGSLNAAIAPWLLRRGLARAPYLVSQGTVLGRRGRVHVDRADDGTIWVGGGTVTCVTGQVDL
ncbi:MAG TPA: PhzF family phenazine biosynthesis protein [Solirubrobacteraceae bacterium]|nr:PhzF family phenazine biosynthesis protein [Solirubrobacteraceae bacterium]